MRIHYNLSGAARKALVTAISEELNSPAHYQGAPTFVAMALTVAAITALYCLVLCLFAQAVSQQVRAHRRLALALQRVAGLFLVGFGLRLALSK